MFTRSPGRGTPSASPLLGALCCLLSCSAAPSWAQDSLSPVVVTATRVPTRVDQALANVTVIDREALDRATGRTLSELLAQQPGVQMTGNGGLGKQSAVFLRGTESRHTLLLIDGVRYGTATAGTPSWDNLPLESIERIEIVQGPMSGLYGSDAVGGVVQVFTRKGRQGLHPYGSVTLGSNRYGQLSAGLGFGQGDWDGSVSAQHTDTRGFSATNPSVQFGNHNPDDDGFRQSAASLQLGLKLPAGWRTDARLMYADGLSKFDDGPGTDSQSQLLTKLGSLQFSGPVAGSWRTLLRLSQSTDHSETLASALGAFNLGAFVTDQRQFTWENTVATPVGTALLLVEQLRQEVSKAAPQYVQAERDVDAVAAGFNGQTGSHTWQANVRRDRNSQFGAETTGSAAYGYDIVAGLRAGGSLGTSFVAPSFNQLYFPNFGNPLLQPERGTTGELNLRWATKRQQLRLAYYETRIRGYMARTSTSTNTDTTINIPRAEIQGWALSHELQGADWTVRASYDRIDARNRDLRSNGTLGSNHDKQLPRRARDNLKLGADFDWGAWRFGATAVAAGDRYDNAANTLHLGGYATADLRADWKVAPKWVLGLRLNNLADKGYQTAYGYNQPGREGFVTLRYSGL
jgi:vitamin B12 transporter